MQVLRGILRAFWWQVPKMAPKRLRAAKTLLNIMFFILCALGGCLGLILKGLGGVSEALRGVLEACGSVLEAFGGVLEVLEGVLEALEVVLEAALGQDSSGKRKQ